METINKMESKSVFVDIIVGYMRQILGRGLFGPPHT